jgi:hypothetical protein
LADTPLCWSRCLLLCLLCLRRLRRLRRLLRLLFTHRDQDSADRPNPSIKNIDDPQPTPCPAPQLNNCVHPRSVPTMHCGLGVPA